MPTRSRLRADSDSLEQAGAPRSICIFGTRTNASDRYTLDFRFNLIPRTAENVLLVLSNMKGETKFTYRFSHHSGMPERRRYSHDEKETRKRNKRRTRLNFIYSLRAANGVGHARHATSAQLCSRPSIKVDELQANGWRQSMPPCHHRGQKTLKYNGQSLNFMPRRRAL